MYSLSPHSNSYNILSFDNKSQANIKTKNMFKFYVKHGTIIEISCELHNFYVTLNAWVRNATKIFFKKMNYHVKW